MTDAPTPQRNALGRFNRWRRTIEVGFWLTVTLGNSVVNSLVALMDVRRVGLAFAAWKPFVWEVTSAAMVLSLVPLLVAFTRRYPLQWEGWQQQALRHGAASVVFSLVHVLGMVALRKLIYATQGESYDFGSWPRELAYEYLKDVRGYAFIVGIIESHRWFVRRMQGEARLLDPPEEGPSVEPTGRPERFLVRKLRREFLVDAGDIEWVQASGNYVNLRVRGHDYPLRSTIASIEARLDPARFTRVHRSYMVNLGHVSSIEPLDTGDARIHMRDAAVVPCSRRYRAGLRGQLGAEA